MKKLLSSLPRLLLAAIVTAVLGTIFSTQKIISASAKVSDLYADKMTFGTRLSNTGYDLLHFGPLYLFCILIAFLIAMGVVSRIARKTPNLSLPLHVGAGAVAMAVMLWGMKQIFFNVQIVAGARDGSGLILQMLAGAIGGWVVWRGRQKDAVAK